MYRLAKLGILFCLRLAIAALPLAPVTPRSLETLRHLQHAPRRHWPTKIQEQLLFEYAQRHLSCTEEHNGCKYVLVTTSTTRGGLGNRLPSIVTGFLLALLTNRTLMVDFDMLGTYFTHSLDLDWHSQVQRLGESGPQLTNVTFEEQPPAANIYSDADFGTYEDLDVLHIYMVRRACSFPLTRQYSLLY